MKSRLLIAACGVVFLTLCFGSPVCAQTKSSNWIKGAWEGTGYQTDDQTTWAMVLTARGAKFAIDYPSLNCGGRWQLLNLNAFRARFKERLDHGQDKCTNNGNVVVQRLNKAQLLFFYSIAGSRQATASAILNRKPKTQVIPKLIGNVGY